MKSRFVASALLVGVFVTVLALIYGIVSKGKDDRPPIIVKGGSIDFGGCPDLAGKKPWIKDLIGNHWKPNHRAGGDTGAFEVTFVTGGHECKPTSLSSSITGNEVAVTYSALDPTTGQSVDTVFTFTKVRYFWLFRHEPKLNAPVSLSQLDPATLTFGSPQQGAITKLEVDGVNQPLPSANPVIRILPKVVH